MTRATINDQILPNFQVEDNDSKHNHLPHEKIYENGFHLIKIHGYGLKQLFTHSIMIARKE